MAGVLLKSTIADAMHAEPEKDANALLMELDKGLRSSRVGEQCESIVRFPKLFEKYPFPILINSAFLKLADVFRIGTNFLRLCILQVTQQSERHLDKITNMEEFVRRLFQVVHSNDPLARAITLRTLGSAARVISERKNVHHSIITGLDSHDTVELEAAIFAADKFSAQSKSFAGAISGKLAEMIDGLSTPVDMKLFLIPIYQHMHHDPAIATQVRDLCTSQMASYSSRRFVLVTLHTLSLLAAKAHSDIPQQVDLLLNYLKSDSRKSVKITALQDLSLLATKAPHMFTTENLQGICEFILETPHEGLQLAALGVLGRLSSSVAVAKFDTHPESPMMQCCNQFCYHGNILLSAAGARILSNMARHAFIEEKQMADGNLIEQASTSVQTLLMMTTNDNKNTLDALRTCLLCVRDLCQSCEDLTSRFVEVMLTALTTASGEQAVLLCECLSAISSYQNSLLSGLLPDLTHILRQSVQSSTGSPDTQRLLVAMTTLLFQACVGDRVEGDCEQVLRLVFHSVDLWTGYKIARQAARYGHHQVASWLFAGLATQVSSEQFYFWLSALRDCSQAESTLHQEDTLTVTAFIRSVTQAQTQYQKGISSLKAATTPTSPLDFQCEYMRLRVKSLQVYTQIIRACCSFQLSPPPAIASTLAMKTGHEIHRCGHVVAQLHKCGQELEQLHQAYCTLRGTAFDADPGTLANLQQLQQHCRLLNYILDTLFSQSPSLASSEFSTLLGKQEGSVPIELQTSINVCQDVLASFNKLRLSSDTNTLSHQWMDCIQQAVMSVTRVPLCLPRFFFQALQSTDIKLAISPRPRAASEPITIHYDTNLTLKVEGIIQHGKRPGLFRGVNAVQLSVGSTQQSRGQMSVESKVQENPPNTMKQTVEPHNDYFSGQFILSFPVTGLHEVWVEAAVCDADGVVWQTGPKSSVLVKSYDEAAQRQQQQQFALQRQQHRVATQHAN